MPKVRVRLCVHGGIQSLLKCMVHGAGTAGIAGAAAFDLSAAVRNYALLGVLEDGWRLGLCQRLGHKSGAGLVCEELLHPRLSVRRSHRRRTRADRSAAARCRADRSGADWALVLGPDELASDTLQLKSLRQREPQRTLTVDEALAQLGAEVAIDPIAV